MEQPAATHPAGVETAAVDSMAVSYQACFAPLMRVAYLLTGSNAVAEDLVHDVFLRCRDRLDQLDHPPSYLRAAVVNACRTHHRHTARHGPLPDNEPDDLPDDLVELRDALARLNSRRRSAVVLRFYCDLDIDEIASLLDCRPATVRSLLHRAVNDLRGELR